MCQTGNKLVHVVVARYDIRNVLGVSLPAAVRDDNIYFVRVKIATHTEPLISLKHRSTTRV